MPDGFQRPRAIEALASAVPATRKILDDYEITWQANEQTRGESPGLYTYVAEVIWPHFLRPALSETKSPLELAEFFNWLEELATTGDGDEVTFVKWGILELVGDRDEWLQRATSLMGPKTAQLSVETESAWGRSHPLPEL